MLSSAQEEDVYLAEKSWQSGSCWLLSWADAAATHTPLDVIATVV